jgi:preprotein translocase subunit SecD
MEKLFMTRRPYLMLGLILVLTALAIWVDASPRITITNPINQQTLVDRNVTTRLGLDLRGGLQVLLEPDLPANTPVDAEAISVSRTIIENRTNALGVAENVIQVAGDRRIVGEFPGLEDSEAVLAILQKTGLLEFVEMGDEAAAVGTIIATDFGLATEEAPTPPASEATAAPTATPSETAPAEGTATPQAEVPPATVYHTVMTGSDLKTVEVGVDEFGNYEIKFTLTEKGAQIFAEYTATHVGQILGITLDKEVISTPGIQSAIPEGAGRITGQFTAEEANALAIQLRYGSLPVPLKIVETRIIGPTLGEDSLRKSLIAGALGMFIVMLFMALYYRLPGLVAIISILFYAAIAFAIFKYFHFTLTLPGIAGFMLSTGAALDANILIFERLKEELRNGRVLLHAVDQGWMRAWSSIRDSNIAAIIISIILFWFGSTFGATIVKGFALTLSLGVLVSLFVAISVTRTLLTLILRWFEIKDLPRWFGI